MREKNWITSILQGNQTCIEHLGHFLMRANLFNGTTLMPQNSVLKVKPVWLCEMAWFPWQPIMQF